MSPQFNEMCTLKEGKYKKLILHVLYKVIYFFNIHVQYIKTIIVFCKTLSTKLLSDNIQ